MLMSDKNNELLQAIDDLRDSVAIKKASYNPHHKSHYAGLNDVLDVIRPEMKKRGLMDLQTPSDENVGPGQILLITRITHLPTGQWVEGRQRIDARQATPQDMGSALTYVRRYSLMTVLGLAAEDDDANAAQGLRPKESQPSKPVVRSVNQQKTAQRPVEIGAAAKNKALAAANKIFALQKQAGLTKNEVLYRGQIDSIKELVEMSDHVTLDAAYERLKAYTTKQAAK